MLTHLETSLRHIMTISTSAQSRATCRLHINEIQRHFSSSLTAFLRRPAGALEWRVKMPAESRPLHPAVGGSPERTNQTRAGPREGAAVYIRHQSLPRSSRDAPPMKDVFEKVTIIRSFFNNRVEILREGRSQEEGVFVGGFEPRREAGGDPSAGRRSSSGRRVEESVRPPASPR